MPLFFINGKISITALIVKGLEKVSLKRPVWGGEDGYRCQPAMPIRASFALISGSSLTGFI